MEIKSGDPVHVVLEFHKNVYKQRPVDEKDNKIKCSHLEIDKI